MSCPSAKNHRTFLSWLIVALLIGGGAHAARIYTTNNFAVVVPGEVYRSAQPDPEHLEAYTRAYGIRTVINLRGESGESWYRDERQASSALGLNHVDFGMSSDKELSREDAGALIALMRDAAKPILVHCRAGSDRTGLAAALYLAAITKAGEIRAEAQLSILYGHIPLPFLSAAYPMDITFEKMEPALGL